MKNIRLKRFIKQGGVIAYPTESCYGLGCDPLNFKAIKKIIRIKKRSRAKNFIVINSNLTQLNKLIHPLNKTEKSKLMSKWPGPHTWLVRASNQCPTWIKNNVNRIAVRIPHLNNRFSLITSIDMNITSTSANRSGQRPVTKYRDACRLFSEQVKIIKGRIGQNKKPSNIQDFETEKMMRE